MTLAPVAGQSSIPEYGYGDRLNRLLLDAYISAAVKLYDHEGRYTADQVRQWLAALACGLARQGD